MTKKFTLKAATRSESGKKTKALRLSGQIPSVVYDQSAKATPLSVNANEFESLYDQAGESSLVDLVVDGKEPVKVIIKDAQLDPVRDKALHVDFYKVNMKKPIAVEVPLVFVGEAKAVKELGGTLVKNLESIEARCLPGDLVDHLEVDLAALDTFEDVIKVSDIKTPDTLEVLTHESDAVANVLEPRQIEEEATPEGEEAAAEEGAEGKAEEKPAEGEANKEEEK